MVTIIQAIQLITVTIGQVKGIKHGHNTDIISKQTHVIPIMHKMAQAAVTIIDVIQIKQ